MISKVSTNLENFSYNVIVANLYETYNFLVKNLDLIFNNNKIKENYKKILTIFCPIIPHVLNECLEDLNENKNIKWPDVDKKLITLDDINIVVQINGKKREILSSSKSFSEKELINETKKITSLQKFFVGKEIKKTIYIKDKLINFII